MAHKRKATNEVAQAVQDSPKILTQTQVPTLSSLDGQRIQELVDLNNTYGALDKQIKQYDATIYMREMLKKRILSGEFKMPLIIHLSQTVSYAEGDKDKAAKHIDNEIKNLKMARQGLVTSYEKRRDDYVEAVIRVSRLLGEKVKGFEIQKVFGVRTGSSDKQSEEDEQKAMENQLEELLKQQAKA